MALDGWRSCPGGAGGTTTGQNNVLGVGTNGITANSGGGRRGRRILPEEAPTDANKWNIMSH